MVPETQSSDLKIQAEDGFSLAATLHRPAESPRGAIVVSAGTGIRRQFYGHLATYLAQQGYLTLTYDYRGIGQSRPRNLRRFSASLTHWARLDMSAALAHMQTFALPVYWVGHSSGAQTLGLARGAQQLRGVVSVASGAASWWQVGGTSRWLCAALLYGYVPLTTSLLGYAPARVIKQGQDLPAGVAQELALWCRSPRYFANHLAPEQMDRITRLKLPWLAMNFSDDDLAPQEAVDQLLGLYPSLEVQRRTVRPDEVGQDKIGHHGFFEPRRSGLLWPELVTFFENC
jgi:predicted alpha/beta hydrolase